MPVSMETWFSRAHFSDGQCAEDALQGLRYAPGGALVIHSLHRGVGEVLGLQRDSIRP